MQKIFKNSILLFIALGIFLLPISPSFEIKKDGEVALGVGMNEVRATDLCEIHFGLPKIEQVASDGVKISLNISVDRKASDENGDGSITGVYALSILSGIGCANSNKSEDDELNSWNAVTNTVTKNANGQFLLPDKVFFIDIGESYDANISISPNPIKQLIKSVSIHPDITVQNQTLSVIIPLSKSTTPKTYYVGARLEESGIIPIFTVRPHPNTPSDNFPLSFILPADNSQINPNNDPTEVITDITGGGYDLACNLIGTGIGTFLQGVMGCVVGFFYLIWEVSAKIGHLAGIFLDFLVYYSTSSGSYANGFIIKSWGAVRDIANIFFIIALLYIALKMILSLGDSHSKKLISTIIIVALLINFSLFFTQVIIDGSNILAKVFYNNIDSKYENKNPAVGAEGEKSISIGLVDKFNPQEIISSTEYLNNQGSFLFITLLAIAITLFTAYIFFTVGLLFVSRVVMLWISMIFAPIAFASYTLPFDIPGLGHKEWWKNLLENAFLAPIFIFMLYIVVMFADFLKEIVIYDGNAEPMQSLMSKVIPFIILSVLLIKAKEMAVKYAGEMGAAMQKFGAMAGGLAIGAAAGGAAMLGRRAIGGGGSYIANKLAARAEKSGNVKTAQKLRDFSKYAQKSSFDARGIKIAGKNLGSVTGLNVGNAKEGGWAEMKKKQDEKRNKRADELKKYGTGEEKKKLAEAEIALKEATLKDATVNGITIPVKLHLENLNKEIDKARIELKDAKDSDPDDGSVASITAKGQMATAKARIDAAQAEKENLRNANSRATGGTGSVADFERDKNKATVQLEVKEDKIVSNYADQISSKGNKVKNVIFRAGAYSVAGADETARNLKSGKKVDSGEKPH